jgi:pimeloyl-ACP methyl ester carboxylesterase
MRQRESGGTKDAPRVQLSFIGHSMGGFVVTNAIRTLSDVFAVRVDALNSYGAVSSPDLRSAATAPGSAVPPADAPSRLIGEAFELKRFVLASPDIPAETLLSSRGNFLASVLSRFDEAYLFSNEGDEVLRQISTLANYFVFPAKGRDHGFRLGNVEILSRQFGMIGVRQQDFLRVLRIGDLTLQELYDTLEDARESRIGDNAPAPEQALLPKRFTYFDCTDYIDSSDPAKDERKNWRALLTFAKCSKQNDPQAKLPWYSHLHLLLAYVARGQKPNVHGGYFQGLLSQELIYRLACLGYAGTVSAYGSEAALSQACEQKQIRMLVSPLLRSAVTPPAPATQTMRPSRRMAPVPAPPPAQPPEQGAPLQVPDLVGMSVVDARAVAEKMPQLLLLEITRPATGSQPKGNVLSQMPAPGTAVAPRTSIEVVIAR